MSKPMPNQMINGEITAEMAPRLRAMLVDPVEKVAKLEGLRFRHLPGARVEPMTRHMIQNGTVSFSNLGYASYSSSQLMNANVGRYCSIAANVRLLGEDHPTDWVTSHNMVYGPNYKQIMNANGFPDWDAVSGIMIRKPTLEIGNDVWIGRDAVLGREIKIGTGAIVAGGAIVTKDVAPYTIVGGVPAKPIRKRLDDATIAELLELEWWNYRISDLGSFKFKDVRKFIDLFKIKKAELPRVPDLFVGVGDLLNGIAPPVSRDIWL